MIVYMLHSVSMCYLSELLLGVLHVQVCVHLSELLLGVSPHSGVLCYVFTHMHVYLCVIYMPFHYMLKPKSCDISLPVDLPYYIYVYQRSNLQNIYIGSRIMRLQNLYTYMCGVNPL